MIRVFIKLFLSCVLAVPLIASAQNDAPTLFTNMDSIRNTRHNMLQDTIGAPAAAMMNFSRNRYGQVCVYCHTPHGANANTAAPLWNRVVGNTSYTLYSSSTMTEVVNNPGAASLPCLSCHDGTQAVDAILNMPGSGQYSTAPNPGLFVPGAGQFKSSQHKGFGVNQVGSGAVVANPAQGCMSCHNPDFGSGQPGDATDFTAFYIGTNLNNDHPLGVKYPTSTGGTTGWNTPGGTKISGGYTNKFFDENGNGRMEKNDIRLYDPGGGARVECGSCHDPHGVPSGAAGSQFLPTFLRKTPNGSAICLTCHAK